MKTIQYKVYDKEGKLRKLINTNKEKQLNDDEWLNGVTCFVINEKGEALIEKRVNKGLTPGKLDLCSGHVDGEETQTQAMIRELKEETGLDVIEILKNTVKGQLFLSPGMTDESVSLVYCTCSGEISTENLEEDEDIETILLSKEDAIKILNSNERCDIKFFMALQSFVAMGDEIFK